MRSEVSNENWCRYWAWEEELCFRTSNVPPCSRVASVLFLWSKSGPLRSIEQSIEEERANRCQTTLEEGRQNSEVEVFSLAHLAALKGVSCGLLGEYCFRRVGKG